MLITQQVLAKIVHGFKWIVILLPWIRVWQVWTLLIFVRVSMPLHAVVIEKWTSSVRFRESMDTHNKTENFLKYFLRSNWLCSCEQNCHKTHLSHILSAWDSFITRAAHKRTTTNSCLNTCAVNEIYHENYVWFESCLWRHTAYRVSVLPCSNHTRTNARIKRWLWS